MSDLDQFDDKALERLGAAALVERNQLLQQIEELRRGQNPQPTPQAKPAAKNWWEYEEEPNPQWSIGTEYDANTGRYKAREGFPAEMAQQRMDYERGMQQFLRDLSTKRGAMLKPFVEQVVAEALKNHTQNQQVMSQASQFLAQQSGWIFEQTTGADGKQVAKVDPISGEPRMSRAGQQFFNLVGEAQGKGIKSSDDQITYAYGKMQMAGLIPQQQAAAPTATPPAQALEDKQRAHKLQELGANRDATVTPAATGKTWDQAVNNLASGMNPNETVMDYFKRSNAHR